MINMKVKEKAENCCYLWLHVNAGGEGMQVRCLLREGFTITNTGRSEDTMFIEQCL
jgi:hypothetical protein